MKVQPNFWKWILFSPISFLFVGRIFRSHNSACGCQVFENTFLQNLPIAIGTKNIARFSKLFHSFTSFCNSFLACDSWGCFNKYVNQNDWPGWSGTILFGSISQSHCPKKGVMESQIWKCVLQNIRKAITSIRNFFEITNFTVTEKSIITYLKKSESSNPNFLIPKYVL